MSSSVHFFILYHSPFCHLPLPTQCWLTLRRCCQLTGPLLWTLTCGHYGKQNNGPLKKSTS